MRAARTELRVVHLVLRLNFGFPSIPRRGLKRRRTRSGKGGAIKRRTAIRKRTQPFDLWQRNVQRIIGHQDEPSSRHGGHQRRRQAIGFLRQLELQAAQ